MPKGTKLRNIRVPDDRWEAAMAKAEAEGTNLSALINDWLDRYLGRAKDDPGR